MNIDEIPEEIFEAALKVEVFFKEHGVETWVLGGLCSRSHAYALRNLSDLKEYAHLFEAFIEAEAWIEAECAAMEKKPESYCSGDRIGLPYMREVVRLVRRKAEKAQANKDPVNPYTGEVSCMAIMENLKNGHTEFVCNAGETKE